MFHVEQWSENGGKEELNAIPKRGTTNGTNNTNSSQRMKIIPLALVGKEPPHGSSTISALRVKCGSLFLSRISPMRSKSKLFQNGFSPVGFRLLNLLQQ